MAKKLHDTYNFSYDALKVLLGGWNTWKENNAQNPSAYPIEVAPGTTPGAVNANPGVTVIKSTVEVNQPLPTQPAAAATPKP